MGEHLKQALHDHAEYSYRMYKVQGSKKDERQRGGSTASASEEEKQHVSVISFDDDEEKARLQRKKRTQEDMVEDFVKLLEKMMNPRQALTSIISAAMGLASITVGIFYFHSFLPDTATKAIELDKLLIAYGALELLLALSFFIACMQTSVAVSRGIKDAVHIVVGVLIAVVYIFLTVAACIVGIVGFYKMICVVSAVEYTETASEFFFPRPLFVTAVGIFVLHIVMIILKCCCCK